MASPLPMRVLPCDNRSEFVRPRREQLNQTLFTVPPVSRAWTARPQLQRYAQPRQRTGRPPGRWTLERQPGTAILALRRRTVFADCGVQRLPQVTDPARKSPGRLVESGSHPSTAIGPPLPHGYPRRQLSHDPGHVDVVGVAVPKTQRAQGVEDVAVEPHVRSASRLHLVRASTRPANASSTSPLASADIATALAAMPSQHGSPSWHARAKTCSADAVAPASSQFPGSDFT